MKRSTFCLGTLTSLLGLSGCGGSSATARALGRATLVIHWPGRETTSRLIPRATNSILVQIRDIEGTIRAQKLVIRPTGTNLSEVTFVSLPIGTLMVQAAAFPTTDGSGVAQATGSGSLETIEDTVTPLGITLGTTIQSVSLAYTPRPLLVGGVSHLQLIARDAAGRVVLTSPSQWVFTTASSSVVQLEGAGTQIRGLALGSVQVSLRDRESGVVAETQVNVMPSGEFFALRILPPTGFESIGPIHVNNRGWVVGTVAPLNSSARVGFVWKPRADLSGGDFTLMEPGSGATITQTDFISDDGLVLGYTTSPQNVIVQWLWENGTYRALPAPLEGALHLNNRRELIGRHTDPLERRPVIVRADGSWVYLNSTGFPKYLHESGSMTGQANQGGNAVVWRYHEGRETTASTPAPYLYSYGISVNAAGQVCLDVSTDSLFRVGLWDGNGAISVLPIPSGYTFASSRGITEDGTVVGTISGSHMNARGVLWRNDQIIFLDTLVQAGIPPLNSISAVSGNGYMLASSWDGYTFHNFLLVPSVLA